MKKLSIRIHTLHYKRFLLAILLVTIIIFCSSKHVFAAVGEISNNKDLVTPAVDGITSVFFDYTSKALSYIIEQFSNDFSPVPTSDYFYEQTGTGSANHAFFNFFFYLGYFLTFTVFAISMMMVAFSGFFDNKNRAFELIVRLIVACVLIVLSRDILSAIDSAFQKVWEQIKPVTGYAGSGNAIDLVMKLATGGLKIHVIFVILVLQIAFIIEFVKFVLEIMERFIVVKLLYISAPAVNGLVVSRTTSSIMINFYRMYFSQLLLLIFNRVFTYLLCAMIANVLILEKDEILPWLFLIATCKAAQRVDSYMKSMGLTVAQTGSALLDSIMGAVNTIGKGYGLSKKGAGIIGAKQMAAGAASGNYGLYKAGMAKQAYAKGGIAGAIAPKSEAATLKSFADAGGAAPVKDLKDNGDKLHPYKDDLRKSMIDSYNRGNYANLATFDTSMQKAAAKDILSGPGNEDAFKKATGFSKDAIESAHFDSKGNIEGTIKTGEGKGQLSTFKVSASELKGRAGIITTTDGQTRNIQTSGDITRMDTSGSYEYSEGGKSNLSTMSGLDLDDERLAELGASSYMIDQDENMLYVGDKDGNIIYERGLETGNEIFAGIEKPSIGENGEPLPPTPNVSLKDFEMDHKLEDFAPTGAKTIEPKTTNNSAVVHTNPTKPGGAESKIIIKGTSGKIPNLNSKDGSTKNQLSDTDRINLNDKNIKIMDNRAKGSYAVYGRNGEGQKISIKH